MGIYTVHILYSIQIGGQTASRRVLRISVNLYDTKNLNGYTSCMHHAVYRKLQLQTCSEFLNIYLTHKLSGVYSRAYRSAYNIWKYYIRAGHPPYHSHQRLTTSMMQRKKYETRDSTSGILYVDKKMLQPYTSVNKYFNKHP